MLRKTDVSHGITFSKTLCCYLPIQTWQEKIFLIVFRLKHISEKCDTFRSNLSSNICLIFISQFAKRFVQCKRNFLQMYDILWVQLKFLREEIRLVHIQMKEEFDALMVRHYAFFQFSLINQYLPFFACYLILKYCNARYQLTNPLFVLSAR